MTKLPKLQDENVLYCYMETPCGILKIAENRGRITEIVFVAKAEEDHAGNSEVLLRAKQQLQEYFECRRKEFDLPLSFEASSFREKVWKALMSIPYGETRSYQDVAEMCMNPKASRAVGNANSHNPIVIVIPCHRVIAKDGSLGGYSYGSEIKKYLLDLEQRGLKQ